MTNSVGKKWKNIGIFLLVLGTILFATPMSFYNIPISSLLEVSCLFIGIVGLVFSIYGVLFITMSPNEAENFWKETKEIATLNIYRAS